MTDRRRDTGDAGGAGGADDPVLARRARIERAARIGQRAGYGLFLASLGLLAAGFLVGFTPLLVNVTTACLVAGSLVLAPAIVAGFAVRAADREDRARGW